jgi:hypothetical protein
MGVLFKAIVQVDCGEIASESQERDWSVALSY